MDSDEDGQCLGETLRVRITIDIRKPLRRGVLLKVGSMADEKWIPITYEKLPDFCYGCGKLGHVVKECDVHVPVSDTPYQYGTWLRTPNSTRRPREGRSFDHKHWRGRERGRNQGYSWARDGKESERTQRLRCHQISEKVPAKLIRFQH